MKKSIVRAAAAVLLLAGAAVWLKEAGEQKAASRKEQANETEYIFTYAENQPEDYPTTKGAREFARLVYERTGGRIRIRVFTEGELGSETEVIWQVRYGGIDFARLSVMTIGDEMALDKLNVLQLPYIYRDSSHMWNVLEGEIGQEILEDLPEYGFYGLSWYDAGARHFYNSEFPIKRLEDMRNLRIRVARSQLMWNMVKALGAQPVTMDYSEVYAALETGKIDGAENNWPSYEAMGHNELAPYITLDAHNRIPELQIVSGATWEKLGEEDRRIIQECARESALYERELWTEREEEVRKELEAGKCQVTILDERERKRFQAMARTVYKDFSKEYGELIKRIEQTP